MAKSRNRPQYKIKKKKNNIKKQKAKEMANELKDKMAKMPVSYTYHKDADHVKIPMRAWQMLNSLAKELQPLAMLVSTFEQLGQEHINDGTLIPVFQEDIEAELQDGAPKIVNGQIQYKLKDAFWEGKVQGAPSDIVTAPLLYGPDNSPLTKESISKLDSND